MTRILAWRYDGRAT